MAARVMVVEDDPSIAELMMLHLTRAGFAVTSVATAQQAVDRASVESFDLLVLDPGLPDFDGLSVCRRVRQHGPNRVTPVLVVTARHSESDVVLALEGGADAVMRKPFTHGELLWRVNGLLRRCRPRVDEGADTVVVDGGSVVMNVARRTVHVEGDPIELTRQEFDVLVVLARQPGRVFSRRALAARVWGAESSIADRAVDIAISRLRRRLSRGAPGRALIQTIRGAGYSVVSRL